MEKKNSNDEFLLSSGSSLTALSKSLLRYDLIAFARHSQEFLRFRVTAEYIFGSMNCVLLISVICEWALYNDDIRLTLILKDADSGLK